MPLNHLRLFERSCENEGEYSYLTSRAKLKDMAQLILLARKTYIESYPDLFENENDPNLDIYFGKLYQKRILPKELKNPFGDTVYFITKEKNEPIGYAKISFYKHRNEIVVLDKLFCLLSHQRKGIGLDLLNHCIDEAIRRGKTKMELLVYFLNQKGINFYENIGFKITSGIVPDPLLFGNKHFDHYIMECNLLTFKNQYKNYKIR